jgi:hypothetical protein
MWIAGHDRAGGGPCSIRVDEVQAPNVRFLVAQCKRIQYSWMLYIKNDQEKGEKSEPLQRSATIF